MPVVVHKRNTSLYTNAGMAFPECYAHSELLDTDKGRLPTTGENAEVTCKRCLLMTKKHEERRRG